MTNMIDDSMEALKREAANAVETLRIERIRIQREIEAKNVRRGVVEQRLLGPLIEIELALGIACPAPLPYVFGCEFVFAKHPWHVGFGDGRFNVDPAADKIVERSRVYDTFNRLWSDGDEAGAEELLRLVVALVPDTIRAVVSAAREAGPMRNRVASQAAAAPVTALQREAGAQMDALRVEAARVGAERKTKSDRRRAASDRLLAPFREAEAFLDAHYALFLDCNEVMRSTRTFQYMDRSSAWLAPGHDPYLATYRLEIWLCAGVNVRIIEERPSHAALDAEDRSSSLINSGFVAQMQDESETVAEEFFTAAAALLPDLLTTVLDHVRKTR